MLFTLVPSASSFKEIHTVFWFYKYIQKICETRIVESIHEWHFVEQNNEGIKLQSEKTRVHAQKPVFGPPPPKKIDLINYLLVYLVLNLQWLRWGLSGSVFFTLFSTSPS
jgi:hypothetical protein